MKSDIEMWPSQFIQPDPLEVQCIECKATATIADSRSWYVENGGETALCPACRNEEVGR